LAAERNEKQQLAAVSRYRSRTGGGSSIPDAPIMDPLLIRNWFICFYVLMEL